jgi:hypothetical protein
MWQRRIPPQLGGEVRIHMTRGSTGVHLSREARSRVIGHMAVPEPISIGGRVWNCRACGIAWMHALLFILS